MTLGYTDVTSIKSVYYPYNLNNYLFWFFCGCWCCWHFSHWIISAPSNASQKEHALPLITLVHMCVYTVYSHLFLAAQSDLIFFTSSVFHFTRLCFVFLFIGKSWSLLMLELKNLHGKKGAWSRWEWIIKDRNQKDT